jgi:hypothetical protein
MISEYAWREDLISGLKVIESELDLVTHPCCCTRRATVHMSLSLLPKPWQA